MSAILFMVTVEAVSDDGNLSKPVHVPVCPQEVIIHRLATVRHEKQGLLLHIEFTVLEWGKGGDSTVTPSEHHEVRQPLQ